MEQSPLGSTPSESEKLNRPEGPREDDDPAKPADRRMVADQLLAALASGNLDHLAQAREAFLNQPATKSPTPTQPPRPHPPAPPEDPNQGTPVEVAASLEHRPAPRTTARSFAAVDELRQEEEALQRVEAELERRRAEVAAAKRKAEIEARRRVFEESKRQLEAETRQQANEE